MTKVQYIVTYNGEPFFDPESGRLANIPQITDVFLTGEYLHAETVQVLIDFISTDDQFFTSHYDPDTNIYTISRDFYLDAFKSDASRNAYLTRMFATRLADNQYLTKFALSAAVINICTMAMMHKVNSDVAEGNSPLAPVLFCALFMTALFFVINKTPGAGIDYAHRIEDGRALIYNSLDATLASIREEYAYLGEEGVQRNDLMPYAQRVQCVKKVHQELHKQKSL